MGLSPGGKLSSFRLSQSGVWSTYLVMWVPTCANKFDTGNIYIYTYIYIDISFWWVCPSILESLKGSANPKGVGIVPTSGALL